jgi:hypothetical protein
MHPPTQGQWISYAALLSKNTGLDKIQYCHYTIFSLVKIQSQHWNSTCLIPNPTLCIVALISLQVPLVAPFGWYFLQKVKEAKVSQMQVDFKSHL